MPAINERLRVVATRVTIARLKWAARRHYWRYQRARDEQSCDATLGGYVSSRVSRHKRAFNTTMDRLAKLDPACPKARL